VELYFLFLKWLKKLG